jgi:choline dehydrogenase-like flavoprotein
MVRCRARRGNLNVAPLHDVIVIGAGPAGLLAAERLEARGRTVLLLEAGPRRHDGKATQSVDPAWRFRALGSQCWWPRAHAVGGRANLWGGWLSRFEAGTFREGGWPYGARELAPYYDAAEAWLGATPEALAPHFRRAARALGLAMRGRITATTAAGRHWRGIDAAAAAGARIGTVARRLRPDGGGVEVEVLRAGRASTLRARAVVLAASPIETTRLLMESGVRHPWLGRRLTDHFNLSYLLIEPNRQPDGKARPPTAFGRFVDRGGARGYRGGFSLELIGPLPIGGLDPDVRALLPESLSRDASFTFVNSLGEQWRHRERYVDLAPHARDALGRPVPRIHFAWSAAERRLVEEMKTACRTFARAIASPGAQLLRYRDPFVAPPIFHPAGTCAMGTDQRAPCDPWGRLRAAPAVWVADASVFPSGGDCHPTLTVLAHTLRVTESVERALTPRAGGTRAGSARGRGRGPSRPAPDNP